MPIEDFNIEQEQEEENYVNILSYDNREDFIERAQEGQSIWVSAIERGWGKSGRFKRYSKPELVYISSIQEGRFGKTIFVKKTPTSREEGLGYGYYNIGHETERGCKVLHDQEILRISQSEKFSVKQKNYKKLLILPPPQDEKLIAALDWKDTLSEEEKSHVDKLIEMSK